MTIKCHYEVLGVPQDADDDSIKKSYRKLALKWHPDKNLENMEEATREFRIVQQAYDVLTDPQERAWYDKHRDAILRGGMGNGENYQDKSVDVYAYFNSSCFDGFHDGEEGFYTVYRKVFEKIAEEDYEYMDDKDSDFEMPNFGDSLSKFDDVTGPFYGFWESYCTAKSYVWCEKWDTREAPDRMTRRAMEQENKKICEMKRKERNEEVRALVSFVKKRDKRVAAHKKYLEEKAKQTAQLAKEKQLNDRKQNLRKLDEYKETEWSSMSKLEDELQQLESQFTDSNSDQFEEDDEEPEDSLFCIVCNKAFKTDKAMLNHEKSKKHKENVALLREEMLAEDETLDLSSSQSEDETILSQPTKLSKKQKKKRKNQKKVESSELNENKSDPEILENDVSLNDADVTNDKKDIIHEQEAEKSEDDGFVHKSTNKNKKKAKKKVPVYSNSQRPNASMADTTKQEVPSDDVSELTCKVCHLNLTSRNKLFEHIKESGHAALKPIITPVAKEDKSNKQPVNGDSNKSADARDQKSKKKIIKN